MPDKVVDVVTELYRLVLMLQGLCPSMRVHLHLSGSTRDGAEWLPLLDDAVLADDGAMHVLTCLYNFIHAESSMLFATERLAYARKRRAVSVAEVAADPAQSTAAGDGPMGVSDSKSRARSDFQQLDGDDKVTPGGGGGGEGAQMEGVAAPGVEGAGADGVGGVFSGGDDARTSGGAECGSHVAGDDGRGDRAMGDVRASTTALEVPSAAGPRSGSPPASGRPDEHIPSDLATDALRRLFDESPAVMGALRDCVTDVRLVVCIDYGVSSNKSATIVNVLPWWPRAATGGGRPTPAPLRVKVPCALVPVTGRRLDMSQTKSEIYTLDVPWPRRGSKRGAWVAAFLVLFDKCAVAKRHIDTIIAKAKALRAAGRTGAVDDGGSSASSESDEEGSGGATGGTDSSMDTGDGSGLDKDDNTGAGGGDRMDKKGGEDTNTEDGDGASGDGVGSASGAGIDGSDCGDGAVGGVAAGHARSQVGATQDGNDGSRAHAQGLLAAMHAARKRAALQQKQIEEGLLKVGAKPKGGASPGAAKGSTGAKGAAHGAAAGRSADKKARKKRHPRDVKNDEEANGGGGGRPPTPQSKRSGAGGKGVTDGVDVAKRVNKPAAGPSCARVVHATSAAATNNGRDNPTDTVSYVSTELANVHVYDVNTLEQLDNVRKNVKQFSVVRERSAMLPSISASCSSMVAMSHATFSKDWKPHHLNAAAKYDFKLCLLTAPEYEIVVAAQANIYTMISVEQLKVAECLLKVGMQSVSSINVEQPSAFCLEVRSTVQTDPTFYMTSSTIADMQRMHEAVAVKAALAVNVDFVAAVSKLPAVGTAMDLTTGADVADVQEEVLSSLMDLKVDEEVLNPETLAGAAEKLPYCPVFSSDIRRALSPTFMTDAIIDGNAVILREWCGSNNSTFYPLLCQQASSFIGQTDYDVGAADATINIKRIARSAAACTATQYGMVINIKQRHWISAVVDVVDHKVNIYDSLPGLEITNAAMPTVLNRLKLFGRMMRDTDGRANEGRPPQLAFHKNTVKIPKQSCTYNCGAFAFARIFHVAHSNGPCLRGSFGDPVRLAMVHNIFVNGRRYRQARHGAQDKKGAKDSESVEKVLE